MNSSYILVLKLSILTCIVVLISYKQFGHHSKLIQRNLNVLPYDESKLEFKNHVRFRRSFRKSIGCLFGSQNEIDDVLIQLDRSQLLEGSTETSSERFEPVQLEKDLGYSSDNDYKKHRKPPNQCSKPKVDNDRKDGKPSNLGSIPKFPYHGSRPVKGIGGWHLLSLDFRKLKKEFMKTPQDLNKDEVGESFKKEFVTYTGRNESNPDKKKKRFRWNRESKKIDKSIDAEITLNSSETPFSFDTDESSFVLKTPERMGHGI